MLLQRSILGNERIFDPFDVIAMDRDDVESNKAFGMAGSLCQEQRGRANELALLVNVDGGTCAHEPGAGPVSNLDENEAIPVLHNKVDFADAAAKIAIHGREAFAREKTQGTTLCVGA